jgi:hypothetical protein
MLDNGFSIQIVISVFLDDHRLVARVVLFDDGCAAIMVTVPITMTRTDRYANRPDAHTDAERHLRLRKLLNRLPPLRR